MPANKVITVYEVTERKVVSDDDRLYEYLVRQPLAECYVSDLGTELCGLPTTKRIEVPIHEIGRHWVMNGMHITDRKFVAISREAEEVFDLIFDRERQEALANLRAERKAHNNTIERINVFTRQPVLTRIWAAIRKSI